jgi:protein-disulfide isomerase
MQYVLGFVLCIPLLLSGCNSSSDQQDISAAVEKALADNPQLVLKIIDDNRIDVFNMMNQAQKDSQRQMFFQEVADGLNAPHSAPEINTDRLTWGNPMAATNIVVYSDFLCGYCAQGDAMVQRLIEVFGDDIFLTVKHMPLHGKPSMVGAKYVEALNIVDPHKAKELYHALFVDQKNLSAGVEDFVLGKLEGLGVGQKQIEEVKKLVKSQQVHDIISSDVVEAQLLGFQGTPSFNVGGVIFKGMAPEEWMMEAVEVIIADSKRSADQNK